MLNRTARVQPDGSWRMDNLPANFGSVRARANCVAADGTVLSGESSFFDLEPDIVNGFDADILLDGGEPIPEFLTVFAPDTTLTAIGATTQLAVIASFPDGSTADVTAATNGTNYTITNPSVATVGPDGLVTAVMSGTVLVSAMLEGALGLFQLQVVLTGDSDGDGIPDDVEVANGLDPDNPLDGMEDPDRDGLTNKQELVDFGTDHLAADTDGDGIEDGEEVVAGNDGFVTNPLLADSDGDGVSDGLEVDGGTDPTDPSDFNLADALDRLEIAPAAVVLTVNTLVGTASQRLTVTGVLKDGSSTDLTAISSGTSYSSSDLFICNFGAEDGRVFAGNDGVCTVTAANSGFTATVEGIVRSFAPVAIARIDLPGFANNVDASGDFAFVASGAAGLQVVDVGDPALPSIVASLPTPGNANDIRIVGSLAYIADGALGGLRIVDVSDPLAPADLGGVDTPGEARDVVVRGNLAYLADGELGGLQIIDISDPAAPAILGGLVTPGAAKGVDVTGSLAVIADGAEGLQLIDVSDPVNPVIVNTVPLESSVFDEDAQDLVLVGNVAIVADGAFTSLATVDLSDPANPIVDSSFSSGVFGRQADVVISGDFALLAQLEIFNGLPIAAIDDPVSPVFRDNLSFTDLGDSGFGTGAAADSSLVYLTVNQGITIVENGDIGDTSLYIGQFLEQVDTEGVPPTVAITAPLAGDDVTEGARLAVNAAASDDVGIAAVDFFVDGVQVATDTTEPFQHVLTVPLGATSLTFGAAAIDFAGSIGAAQDVTVNVIPDPLTTAIGQVLDPSGLPLSGADVGCLTASGVTDLSGNFSLPGLPTVKGAISCFATATLASGDVVRGLSAAVPPLPGGITDVGQIQTASRLSIGTEFWLAYQDDLLSSATAELFILSDVETLYSVTGPNGFATAGTVSPSLPATIPLPTSAQIETNEVIEDKGIHVLSDEPVSVLFHHATSANREMYLGLPKPALGTEYLVLSSGTRDSEALSQTSQFVILGVEATTSISLFTSCTSINGTAAGSLIDLVLNAGQTYQYQCTDGGDVTGSEILGDKPFAVIAGHSLARIPPESPGAPDLLAEMLFPSYLYGTDFFGLFDGGFFLKVMASQDNTLVTVEDISNVVSSFVLNRGQSEDLENIIFSLGNVRIRSDKPISVMQYGDSASSRGPYMMQLIPNSAFTKEYRFFVPDADLLPRAPVVVPNSAVSSLLLNGQEPFLSFPGFGPLPGGTHQEANVVILFSNIGQNVLTADEPFGAYVRGARFGQGYGYPAGL